MVEATRETAVRTYEPRSSRLREERRRKFLSMEELAEKAGVHHQTIWRIENGKPVKGVTVRKVAQALGVDPSELVSLT